MSLQIVDGRLNYYKLHINNLEINNKLSINNYTTFELQINNKDLCNKFIKTSESKTTNKYIYDNSLDFLKRYSELINCYGNNICKSTLYSDKVVYNKGEGINSLSPISILTDENVFDCYLLNVYVNEEKTIIKALQMHENIEKVYSRTIHKHTKEELHTHIIHSNGNQGNILNDEINCNNVILFFIEIIDDLGGDGEDGLENDELNEENLEEFSQNEEEIKNLNSSQEIEVDGTTNDIEQILEKFENDLSELVKKSTPNIDRDNLQSILKKEEEIKETKTKSKIKKFFSKNKATSKVNITFNDNTEIESGEIGTFTPELNDGILNILGIKTDSIVKGYTTSPGLKEILKETESFVKQKGIIENTKTMTPAFKEDRINKLLDSFEEKNGFKLENSFLERVELNGNKVVFKYDQEGFKYGKTASGKSLDEIKAEFSKEIGAELSKGWTEKQFKEAFGPDILDNFDNLFGKNLDFAKEDVDDIDDIKFYMDLFKTSGDDSFSGTKELIEGNEDFLNIKEKYIEELDKNKSYQQLKEKINNINSLKSEIVEEESKLNTASDSEKENINKKIEELNNKLSAENIKYEKAIDKLTKEWSVNNSLKIQSDIEFAQGEDENTTFIKKTLLLAAGENAPGEEEVKLDKIRDVLGKYYDKYTKANNKEFESENINTRRKAIKKLLKNNKIFRYQDEETQENVQSNIQELEGELKDRVDLDSFKYLENEDEDYKTFSNIRKKGYIANKMKELLEQYVKGTPEESDEALNKLLNNEGYNNILVKFGTDNYYPNVRSCANEYIINIKTEQFNNGLKKAKRNPKESLNSNFSKILVYDYNARVNNNFIELSKFNAKNYLLSYFKYLNQLVNINDLNINDNYESMQYLTTNNNIINIYENCAKNFKILFNLLLRYYTSYLNFSDSFNKSYNIVLKKYKITDKNLNNNDENIIINLCNYLQKQINKDNKKDIQLLINFAIDYFNSSNYKTYVNLLDKFQQNLSFAKELLNYKVINLNLSNEENKVNQLNEIVAYLYTNNLNSFINTNIIKLSKNIFINNTNTANELNSVSQFLNKSIINYIDFETLDFGANISQYINNLEIFEALIRIKIAQPISLEKYINTLSINSVPILNLSNFLDNMKIIFTNDTDKYELIKNKIDKDLQYFTYFKYLRTAKTKGNITYWKEIQNKSKEKNKGIINKGTMSEINKSIDQAKKYVKDIINLDKTINSAKEIKEAITYYKDEQNNIKIKTANFIKNIKSLDIDNSKIDVGKLLNLKFNINYESLIAFNAKTSVLTIIYSTDVENTKKNNGDIVNIDLKPLLAKLKLPSLKNLKNKSNNLDELLKVTKDYEEYWIPNYNEIINNSYLLVLVDSSTKDIIYVGSYEI